MENTFDYHFEKAVKATLDSNKTIFCNNSPTVKSNLKRHVQLLVFHKINKIVDKLIP